MNEFCELQIAKFISIEFTLLVYLFLYEGVGFKHLATHDPDVLYEETNSPSNYVLRFFVTALLFLCIGSFQYVVAYALKPVFPHKSEQFVDICSVCNVSILMFDNSYKGFYIHGKSPYGQSEVSAEVLQRSLEYEALGKAQSRGLLKDDDT